MKKAILFACIAFSLAFPAQATVMGIGAGDLIKLPDDHNPATTVDEVVYYLDVDWVRHPFPNLSVFRSWYADFSSVKTVSAVDMAAFRLGTPVTYRPGTRLVKIASVPKVYAVEPGGALRWITSETVAKSLYGNDWSKRVDDVPESFFASYHETAPLLYAIWPTGSVVRRHGDGKPFLIDGLSKRYLSDEDIAGLGLQARHFVRASGDLLEYENGGDVKAGGLEFSDVAQLAFLDTPSVTVVDYPAEAVGVSPGVGSVLGSFRVTPGMAAALRQVAVRISGLGTGTAPFTNIRITDEQGNVPMGVLQLPSDGGDSVTLTFDGLLHIPANVSSVVQVRADVPVTVPSGTKFAISFPPEGLKLVEGGNTAKPLRFWHPPVVTTAEPVQ